MKKSGSIIGFTLIELLVVIAIIGILAALLLPALVKARDSAMMAKCQSNMKNLASAYIIYSSDNDGWFPRWWFFHAAMAAYVGIDEGNLQETGYPTAIENLHFEKAGRIDTAEILKRLYSSQYDSWRWRSYTEEEAEDAAYLATTVFRCPKDVGRGATTPHINQIAVISYGYPYSIGFGRFGGTGTETGWPEDPWWARHYFTMGRILDPAQTALMFEVQSAEGENYFGCVNLWPDGRPFFYPVISDRSRGMGSNFYPFTYRMYVGDGSPWTNVQGNLAYRHGGEKWLANLAFMDGHVETVMPKDLFAHGGGRNERGWIWSLHLPGGKTPDWYDTYTWYTRQH